MISGWQSFIEKILDGLFSSFEKTIDALKHPFMILLAFFLVVVFLAFFLVGSDIDSILGFALIVGVVLIFALLAAALYYTEEQNRHKEEQLEHKETQLEYAESFVKEFKKALRDVRHELYEERAGSSPSSSIRIAYIEHSPPGNDVEGEFVAIENLSETVVDLTGWTLHDEAGHTFTFPSCVLKPGAYVRIWTKLDTDTVTDLYWGRNQAVWNNEGDYAYLQDGAGALVDTYCYGSASRDGSLIG